MKGICSICSSPPHIREIIDAELMRPSSQRMRLRDLEKLTHVSKSSLSRHTRKCLIRSLLSEHRQKMHVDPSANIYVLYPNNEVTRDGLLIDLGTALKEYNPDRDVLLCVEYENLPFRNPSGAKPHPIQHTL
jgi:hypothetical protein